jgi:hypothetical protein
VCATDFFGSYDAHGLLSAGQMPDAPGRPLLRAQRTAGQRELRPQVVQVPLQGAVERDACAHEALAVTTSSRTSSSGPASAAVDSVSIPAANAARATEIASI